MLPGQVSFAHLFPFPGENPPNAELGGTELSSPGSPPSPASRNSTEEDSNLAVALPQQTPAHALCPLQSQEDAAAREATAAQVPQAERVLLRPAASRRNLGAE